MGRYLGIESRTTTLNRNPFRYYFVKSMLIEISASGEEKDFYIYETSCMAALDLSSFWTLR